MLTVLAMMWRTASRRRPVYGCITAEDDAPEIEEVRLLLEADRSSPSTTNFSILQIIEDSISEQHDDDGSSSVAVEDSSSDTVSWKKQLLK